MLGQAFYKKELLKNSIIQINKIASNHRFYETEIDREFIFQQLQNTFKSNIKIFTIYFVCKRNIRKSIFINIKNKSIVWIFWGE